jgi:crossover junction endodeoxyribonuclease RuvC
MRVLGVDPGMTRCGVGVIDSVGQRKVKFYKAGVIRSDQNLSQDARLAVIYDALDEWIKRTEPDVIAVERVFSQENRHSVLGTAQVAGIALVLASKNNVPVALHTPTEVKAAVTGNGQAGKRQVQNMVSKILKLDSILNPPDAADALALAITHVWRPNNSFDAGAQAGAQTGAQPQTQTKARVKSLDKPTGEKAIKKWQDAERKASKQRELKM